MQKSHARVSPCRSDRTRLRRPVLPDGAGEVVHALARADDGDPLDLNLWMRDVAPLVQAAVTRLGVDEQAAEELVLEAVEAVWLGVALGREMRRPAAYLSGTLGRLLARRGRHTGRLRLVSPERLDARAHDLRADDWLDALPICTGELADLIDELPERPCSIQRMRLLEGRSNREVMDELGKAHGVQPGTVMSWIHDANRALRRLVAGAISSRGSLVAATSQPAAANARTWPSGSSE